MPGYEYVKAKRTTNYSYTTGGWHTVDYDTVVVDTHSGFSLDHTFTAGSDGLLLCFSTAPHSKAANTNTTRLMRLVVNAVGYNAYVGQHEVNPVTQAPVHGLFTFKRVAGGDAVISEIHGQETRTFIAADDKLNIQYFLIPEGAGLGAVIEQHSNHANLAGVTESSGGFVDLVLDMDQYGEGAWKGVDDKTFTMPGDGWVWATLHTVSTTGTTDQRWSKGLRAKINGTPDNMSEFWSGFQETGWAVQRSCFFPVSSGDEVIFQHAYSARSAKIYTATGFDANSRNDLLLTVRFFAA